VPILTVEGYGSVSVTEGKRLVLAIEQDAGVDILHACGGNARCTTCRVEFIDGEPARHTVAERERLAFKGLSGVRLSCQIVCDHDMAVRATKGLVDVQNGLYVVSARRQIAEAAQRMTGGAYSLSSFYPADRFKVTQGETISSITVPLWAMAAFIMA